MRKASRLSEALEENYIQCYSILNAGQSTELQCFNVAKGTQSEVEVRKSQTEASEQCLQRTETRATGGSGKRKESQWTYMTGHRVGTGALKRLTKELSH